MNEEKNEKVRQALHKYFELYDYPSKQQVAKSIGINYYRFNTFLNGKATYADKSLNEIVKYLDRVCDRSIRLEEIIKKLK